MFQTISRRGALIGLGALVLAAPHVAHATPRVLRLGHNQVEDSHYGRGGAAFAAAVAANPLLGSVIRIEVHGNAELGDELGMLKSCANSTLDLVVSSNSVVGNLVPEYGLLNAPFVFTGLAHARAALDGPVGNEFADLATPKNIHLIAWGENGLRQITANRPIRNPADLKGLKIRVPQSEVMLGGMRALGADAAPLSFNLLHEALRTGQFDAQENPIVIIEANKFNELQKYLSLTGHIYDPAVFMASADTMEDLNEAQRAAFIACAGAGAVVTRQVSEAGEKQGIARLKAAGMVVVDDIDATAFRAAAQPYLESLTSKFGAERVHRLISAGA